MYNETIAYKAGEITAHLHNIFHKRNDLPSVFECMKNFMHLKTVMTKYYNLLKANKNINHKIIEYEIMISKLGLKDEEKGTFVHFIVAYGNKINKKLI